MSDHETPGFTVVDRRQAVAENAAKEGDAAPETSAQAASNTDPDVDNHTETDGSSSVEPQHHQEEEATPDSESEERGMPDPVLLLSIAAMQLDVRSLTKLLVPIFDGQAWRSMGFLADPRTGETQQDLPAAQLAIDCVQFLLGKIGTDLPESERREMERRLNDLRMNYLSKLREGQA